MPRATGQLTAAAIDAAEACVAALARRGVSLSAIELTENIAGDERVLHVDPADGSELPTRRWTRRWRRPG